MTTDSATVMFPSATGPAAPSAPGEATKTESEIFYPKLYDESIRNSLIDVAELDGNSLEETEGLRSGLAADFHALSLTPPEARTVLESMVKLAREPAKPEELDAWAQETRRELRQKYGKDATDRLNRAYAHLARTPALREALHESGLSNRADVVMMLAERAYRG